MAATTSTTISDAQLCQTGKPGPVLSVRDAIRQAVDLATPITDSEFVPLPDAPGRVLATDITAPIDLPRFDNSAMDGYAIRSADLVGDGPWTLTITDLIAAGDAGDMEIGPGEAARILTGAPIPPGADTVIMQERTTIVGVSSVRLHDRPNPGANIRRRGEDVSRGSALLPRGTLLQPQHLALLAAAGVSGLRVARRLRVGMISTGSELREPGEALTPGQIYNSNRYYLRALLARPWIELRDFGIVRDDPASIRTAVRNAALDCDVLITTGGVSVGDKDHMLDVLQRENAALSVMKVAMRPGKPLTVGRIGDTFYAGLPGNPFAAAVTLMQIGLPAMQRKAGVVGAKPDGHKVRAAFSYTKRAGRTEFVPARVLDTGEDGLMRVDMIGRGSSASLSPFAQADGIAALPVDASAVESGDMLTYYPLRP